MPSKVELEEKKRKTLKELAEGKLWRLLFAYSWPALVSISMNALYSVIDRLYIGQGCGEAAMAALQLVMPVMMLFTALGVFIGLGHSTLLSIRLGANDYKGCEQILGELLALKILLSLVLPPLIFFNVDTVLMWCGGAKVSEETLRLAASYLRIVVFSQSFSHIAFGLSAAMRSEGSVNKSMMAMVVGFGVNLILDPIFIFGFKMGVDGAAWATDIAMVLSALYAFHYYVSGRSIIRLRLGRCRIYREWLWKTSAIGFSPFLQNLLSSLIVVSLASALGKWSPDAETATRQIASLGVFSCALILIFTPIMGAQQGLQPIFGYNWGARNFARVKETLTIGFWVTTALCIFACVVQVVPPFPKWIAMMFVSTDNPALIDTATKDLVISNCMIWCISFNVLATTYYQAIGKPRAATVLSTLRQGVILLPAIWILPHLIDDHTFAIWLALPISDVICQIATIPPLWISYRHLKRLESRWRK